MVLLGVKRLVGGVWVGTPQPDPPPPPPPPGPTPLPTGAGIFTFQQTRQPTIQAASAWVATQAPNIFGVRILTFPAGVYPIVPDFGGPSGSNAACTLSPKVNHIGQGRAYTIWQVNGTFRAGTQDPLPTTGTNSLYVVKQDGGASLTFQGIQIDDATFPIVDLRTHNNAGGTNTQLGKAIPHNIMRMHSQSNPTITDVKIIGGQGLLNTPPGETFSFNLWVCTNAQFFDCEIDGVGKAAALFGVNGNQNGSPVTFTRCYAHDSGHSHGFAMFQAGPVDRVDCISNNNGGVGGSAGAGFNSEGCAASTGLRDIAVGNTLTSYRYEAGPVDGGGNISNHKLTDCVGSGAPYAIWTEKLQTSQPIMSGCDLTGRTAFAHYKA